MLRYALRRIGQMLPTLALAVVAVFFLARAMPGDAVSAMLGERGTDEAVARLTAELGLDRSVPEQFWSYVTLLAQGNLGMSIGARVPVLQLVAERLPATLLLTLMAIILSLLLSLPLAFIAALRAGRWEDVAVRSGLQVGLSAPIFFLGLLLLTLFAAQWRIFPVGGYGDTPLEHIYHLFLPALTLALSFTAVATRSLRASLLGTLRAEHVAFARSKGLPESVVMRSHVLRPAAAATVSLVGLQIGGLLGGAVITESVFAIPGVGRLMVDSIFARDYPVVQGLTLVLAVLVSLTFLATDLTVAWLDPRATQRRRS
ncbi:Dipeptide transport system permease protein dppB [Roseomonas mucosa]|uniref:Dipeptide transport system permease protein dppB n=1 Tax=Roseomonas mucosa TaxID=207340 RepID=A0A379N229_9PROT|nr:MULTISPECIES: ABC transporter permease [Roseomonas]MBS5902722.1 ABC transporter permease [Acetobacteraceae bacterium]MCG7353994.1 ABC transporter permease [Roseomonas mucosa]MCG7359114.1 ABC transporter permease [Roseomonas mucosa]MDT8289584.1 ABC transporter permease [Roseomonas mucosa]MDT8292866.1 ABC transporter permease [Roseomonas mucosa]